MRHIISIGITIVALLLMPITASAQGFDPMKLLGQGLGAYGAAKLCGKGPATAVGCGIVGAEIGGAILSFQPRRAQPQYTPQYGQRVMTCQTIALQMINGQPAVGTACMNEYGQWQIVNIQPY